MLLHSAKCNVGNIFWVSHILQLISQTFVEKINSMSIVRIGVTYNRDDRREQKERIETKAKRNHKKNRRTERE